MMLDAFVRASSVTGGERLFAQGITSVGPMTEAFEGLHSSDVADLCEILTNVTFGAMSRYVAGDLPVSGILPAIERMLSWLKEPSEDIPRQGEKSSTPQNSVSIGPPIEKPLVKGARVVPGSATPHVVQTMKGYDASWCPGPERVLIQSTLMPKSLAAVPPVMASTSSLGYTGELLVYPLPRVRKGPLSVWVVVAPQ